MIEAKMICDSIAANSPRLVTMWCRYPKFVHGEHLRHRSFSFSVSSSRAIPVAKNLEEVRSDELRATPVWWGREQKGMQSGEELEEPFLLYSKRVWAEAARYAASYAEEITKAGAHKSIVNRLLEPFLHVNVLVTGTAPSWMNFFGLRLDRAAQPEIRALAEAQWRVWNESVPRKLEPGQWHLPFVEIEDEEAIVNVDFDDNPKRLYIPEYGVLNDLIYLSVARCARLSHTSFETGRRSTIEEDLALYDRLVGAAPIHASPAEHQATPDEVLTDRDGNMYFASRVCAVPKAHAGDLAWKHPEQAGNLGAGWRQYRKLLPNEAVAPLPSALTERARLLTALRSVLGRWEWNYRGSQFMADLRKFADEQEDHE